MAVRYRLAGGKRVAGRLTNLDSDLPGSVSIDQAWDYDYLNRVTQYTNSLDTYFNGGVTDYDYDDLNQLTEEDPGTAQNYTYDASGNRSMTGYVFGPGNRIEEDGTYTYTYDNEGNLTSRSTPSGTSQNFTYDHRNRLTSIDLVSGSVTFYILEYEYDTFNRRVSRTKTQQLSATGGEGGGPITHATAEKFVYDGDNVAFDFYKPDGGSFALARRYLFGPGVDQILAQENVDFSISSADRVYWMLTDNLGSVRDLMAADGTQVAYGHYKYDAFGRVLDGDTPYTRYLFTGREYDLDTELQYNRNRWYDPASGRWLSEDPIGFTGDPSNLYRYVGNSATNATDPYGLVLADRELQGKFSFQIDPAGEGKPSALNSDVEVRYNVSVYDTIIYSKIELHVYARTIARNFLWGGFPGSRFDPIGAGQEQWHRDYPKPGQFVRSWPANSMGPVWTDHPGFTLYRGANISLYQEWEGQAWGLSKCDGKWHLIKKARWGHSATLSGGQYNEKRWP